MSVSSSEVSTLDTGETALHGITVQEKEHILSAEDYALLLEWGKETNPTAELAAFSQEVSPQADEDVVLSSEELLALFLKVLTPDEQDEFMEEYQGRPIEVKYSNGGITVRSPVAKLEAG